MMNRLALFFILSLSFNSFSWAQGSDVSSINYECRVESAADAGAIYTTIPFSYQSKSSKLKIGALSNLGYSVEVRNVLIESELGQIVFELKEPNGAHATLLTTTSSPFTYIRAPFKIECSKVK